MRRIKLIWEFGGADSKRTAEHHEIHLKEFSQKENLLNTMAGTKVINEFSSIAYLVVNEDVVFEVRDALLPKRAEVYES